MRASAEYIVEMSRSMSRERVTTLMPDSFRQAVGLVYAEEKSSDGLEPTQIDADLEALGYSTEQLVGVVVELKVRQYGEEARDDVQARTQEAIARGGIIGLNMMAMASALNEQMRRDMTAIGYELPELHEDGSYGRQEAEAMLESDGEFCPDATDCVLPDLGDDGDRIDL